MTENITASDIGAPSIETVRESLPPTESDLGSVAGLLRTRQHVAATTSALMQRDDIDERERAACVRAIVKTTRALVAHDPDTGVTAALVTPHRDSLRQICLDGLGTWRLLDSEASIEAVEQFVTELLELLAGDVDDPQVARRVCETLADISTERPQVFHEGIMSEPRPVSELVGQLLKRVRRATPAGEPPELSEQLDVVSYERRAVWLRWMVLIVLETVPYDDELVATVERFRTTQDAPAVTMGVVDDDTSFASLLGALVGRSSSGPDSGNTDALRDMPRAEQFRTEPLGTVGPVLWRLFLGANPALSSAQRRRRRCLSVSDLVAADVFRSGGLSRLFALGRTTVQTQDLVDALCDGIHPAHRSQCNLLCGLYEYEGLTLEDRHLESIRSSAVEVSLPPSGPVAESWITLAHVAVTDTLLEDRRETILERLAKLPVKTELDMTTAEVLSVLLRAPSFTDDERTTALNRLQDAADPHPDTVHWLARTLDEPYGLGLTKAVAPDVHVETLYDHLDKDRLTELYGSLRAAFETHMQGHGSPSVRAYDDLRLLAAAYDALPTTEEVVDPDTVFKRAMSAPPERTRLFTESRLFERNGWPVADRTVTEVLHRAIKENHLSASRRSSVVLKILSSRRQDDGTFVPADRRLITTALEEGIAPEEPGLGTVTSCTRVIEHADGLGLDVPDIMDLVAVVTQALEDESQVGKEGWALASALTGEIRVDLHSEWTELNSNVRSLLATALNQAWDEDDALDIMKVYRQL